MFVDQAEVNSTECRELWARLARGEFDRRQYKRIKKSGEEIWIEVLPQDACLPRLSVL